MTSATSAPVPDSVRPEPLSILLEASSLLANAAGEEMLLSQTLDLARGLLAADAYAVWRESEDGRTWRAIARRGLSEAYPETLELSGRLFPEDVWTMEEIVGDERAAFSPHIYEVEGIRSGMVVPWMLGGTAADKTEPGAAMPGAKVNGAIAYYWHGPRRFTDDDVDYARALSNLSAAALSRLELNEQNRREKQRLAFLAEASELLASSLDYEATLDRVARLAVRQIAEWCTVHVADSDIGPPELAGAAGIGATRVAMAHADPAMAGFAEEYGRRYPEKIDPEHGVGRVLRTGEPEVVAQITDEMLAAAAKDEEHLRMLRMLKLSSSIVVPMVSRGKALGAVRLLGTGGHHLGASDVQLALDLGRRAAAAIENARLHRALLEQDAELRLSHAAARMGSWSWDIERDRLFWSEEFKALHGLPPETEPTPELSYELVHEEDRERAKREFWETVEGGASVFESEHRAMTPDGRILWLQVRGRVQRSASGKATRIAGLIIDVTESRLAEQALRRAEKLAAAGRLAATVAHEVNNPLEALVNVVYLAQRTEGLPQEAAEHLSIADGELRRMAHIVRQTLGFYRESTLPKATGMVRLVSEALDLYRSRGASRGVTLHAPEAATEEISATVIAGEIKQVLANLIANAIDATPAGGRVETSVARCGNCVEIVVSDTGSGIAETNRKRLFEPFFTTKADVGTGLGLWVSKGIVEKHGGTITIDVAAGAGTTVRVRLPAVATILPGLQAKER
jgi:PAS domain S-box-containing protein